MVQRPIARHPDARRSLLLSPSTHGPPRSSPGSRVRAGPLTARRHAAAMAKAAIAADIHQALDIHGDFPTEVALDSHLLVDDLAQAIDLVVRQVTHPRVGIDIRAFQKLLACVQPNAIDDMATQLRSRFSRGRSTPAILATPIPLCALRTARSIIPAAACDED